MSLSARIQIPEKLERLFSPARYKIVYGGRGSAKSWSIARAFLVEGLKQPLRILCAREIQRTIADSVHRLLADQITTLGFGEHYRVLDTEIRGVNGTEFLFAGLRQQDAHKIRSFEGVDRAWVEEAQTVTKRSWDILIPTIRKAGSEIWVSFNPELDTDDTYMRFVAKPPPGATVVQMNFRDNPWFGEPLKSEMELKKRSDPEGYENIWEGKTRIAVEGAIYGREVAQMIEEQRIRAAPYDPKLKVHTIWDLGWNDQTSIIFAQRLLSEVRLIDYEEASFLRFDEWAKRINAKPYLYGNHWLPHDGDHELQASGGLSARQILKGFLGKDPKIITRPETVEVPIKAARMMFPRVYIDEAKCERLVQCLKRFRRGIPESTGEPGTPVKDEFRHGADAFGGLAMIVDQLTNEDRKLREVDRAPVGANAWMS